jgi:hypothetical protein
MIDEYVVDWDKVYACCLSMTAMDNFCRIMYMTSQALPIRREEFPEYIIKELMDHQLLLQSGSSLRLPKDVFRFV